MARRNIRLQDFQIAESDPGASRTTCACIGRKSYLTAASGNDNKNVCIWKSSKPQAQAVLKGHTSDVLSVTYSNSEDYLFSGADGGTVFCWDLSQLKVAYSLKGHLTGCRCISTGAQPVYLATGSTDTNVKVWDLRRRQCVQTFKGHRGPITSVAFSPDGRWVASGSEDCTIRIWDLQTSKKLAEFSMGESVVTVVKFNPLNLSLASGHADRTVKYWDLENFVHVSTTSPDSAGVSSICFEPNEGTCLFSAGSESLRCWEIESAILLDNIESAWKGVMDIEVSVLNEFLIGLAASGNTFSSWTVYLNTINFDPQARERVGAAGVRQEVEQPQLERKQSLVVDRKPPARKATMPVRDPPMRSPDHPPPGDGFPPRRGEVRPAEAPASVPSRAVDFTSSFIPTDTRNPIGLNPSDFLEEMNPSPPSSNLGAVSELEKIHSGHRYFLDAINERTSLLKTCADYIKRGNTANAVKEVTRGTDYSVAIGVLKVFLLEDTNDLTIEGCTHYLTLAEWLLDSASDNAVKTAIESVLTTIKRFGEFIISTLTAPETIGVDLSKEERRKKCKACLLEIQKICTVPAVHNSSIPQSRDLAQEYEALTRRVGNSLD